MTKEKKADIAAPAVKESIAAPVSGTPQELRAFVDSSKPDAPIVLSQTPPAAPSDVKLAFDKPSSVVASPLAEKK